MRVSWWFIVLFHCPYPSHFLKFFILCFCHPASPDSREFLPLPDIPAKTLIREARRKVGYRGWGWSVERGTMTIYMGGQSGPIKDSRSTICLYSTFVQIGKRHLLPPSSRIDVASYSRYRKFLWLCNGKERVNKSISQLCVQIRWNTVKHRVVWVHSQWIT